MIEAQWQRDYAELSGDMPEGSEGSEGSEKLSLAFPGSRCPYCNAEIKPMQNIPRNLRIRYMVSEVLPDV